MKMIDIVERCDTAKFGPLIKAARDYAALLDGDCLNSGSPQWGIEKAVVRQEVFEEFCAIFARAGLPVPPLELEWETVRAQLGGNAGQEAAEEAARIGEHVISQLGGKWVLSRSKQALALARLLNSSPALLGPYGSSRGILLAELNNLLLSAGLQPIRPDHAALEFGDASGRRAPERRPLRVLIVDDTPSEIVKTFRAVAGHPGLILDAQVAFGDWDTDPDLALTAAAQRIIAWKPDIVLMDQGMGRISGSDLIRKVRELVPPDSRVVFVGNTGGSPEELRDAGAIGNMDKGRDIQPLLRAISLADSDDG